MRSFYRLSYTRKLKAMKGVARKLKTKKEVKEQEASLDVLKKELKKLKAKEAKAKKKYRKHCKACIEKYKSELKTWKKRRKKRKIKLEKYKKAVQHLKGLDEGMGKKKKSKTAKSKRAEAKKVQLKPVKAAKVAKKSAVPKTDRPVKAAPDKKTSGIKEVKTVLKAPSVPPSNTRTVRKAGTGQNDNLKRIEGIGVAIERHLKAAGIITFAQLAASSQERLLGILEAAGPRYRMHHPGTWPEQAALAAKGDYVALKALQDVLKGGRR